MHNPSWKGLKGDALMDYLLNSRVQRKEVIKELEEQIEDGLVTFKHRSLNQEAILHPSSKKEGVFQFTVFDKKGAIGDIEATSTNEIATKIEEYGFESCDESDLKLTILAGDRQQKEVKKVMALER